MTIHYTMRMFAVAVALFFGGLLTHADAQVPGVGGGTFGGEVRGVTQLKGTVVCVGCTLEEAQGAQPQMRHLYQLVHARGQLVMAVQEVNRSAMWEVWPHRLLIRTPNQLFQQLTAEANLFKNVELLGLLTRGGRTFDLFEVTLAEG
jgi:hypothetical protein